MKTITPEQIRPAGRPVRIKDVFFVGNRDDRERVQLAFAGCKPIKVHWLDVNAASDLKTELKGRLEAFGPKAQRELMVTSGSFARNPTPNVARRVVPQASYVHITSNIGDCAQAVYNADIDQSLHYTGDLDVYITAVRLVEAHLNFGNDDKPITLVVEDQPKYYTPFLKTLESFNRGRTWMLLARTYDEAEKIVDDYGSRLCTVITDLQYRRAGIHDPNAGERLIQHIKERPLRIPIILNSLERKRIEEKAAEYGVVALWKDHQNLLGELGRIMKEHVFGGFVFRTPRGRVVTEPIHDAKVLAMVLRQMTAEIVLLHSDRNDFSRWLQLQGYLKTAKKIKPWRGQDGKALRHRIAELLEEEIEEKEQAALKRKKGNRAQE